MLKQKIYYAIDKITQKNIYDVDIIQQLDLATTKKQGEVTTGWLREFSSIHMDEVRNDYLQNVLNRKGSQEYLSQTSANLSLSTVIEKINHYQVELESID